jgi:hypothetical protein
MTRIRHKKPHFRHVKSFVITHKSPLPLEKTQWPGGCHTKNNQFSLKKNECKKAIICLQKASFFNDIPESEYWQRL